MAGVNWGTQAGRKPTSFGYVADHNEYKMAENALSHMLLKLIIDRVY